jgi:predicted transcriptional regulator
MSCIFLSLSSVSLLTKERSSLRVCSRSKIAGDDLKFGTVTLQLDDVKNSLTEIENKISDITLEFNKIKEHASDLQTFLSLPHLISKECPVYSFLCHL